MIQKVIAQIKDLESLRIRLKLYINALKVAFQQIQQLTRCVT
jgi:hypothetical protein